MVVYHDRGTYHFIDRFVSMALGTIWDVGGIATRRSECDEG